MIGAAVVAGAVMLGVPAQIGSRAPIEQSVDDTTGVAQADLAFVLLDEIRRELLDVRVTIGTRDKDIQERAERAAYDAARLLAVSQELMASGADDLARLVSFWDDEQMQESRSEMLVSYLEHRVPIAIARATVLLGMLEDDAVTRATYGELIVEEISGRLPMDGVHRAELALMRAYGEVLQGQDGTAIFMRALKLAREHGRHKPALVLECALQTALHAGGAADVVEACLAVANVPPFVDEGTESSDSAMLMLMEGMLALAQRLDMDESRAVLVAATELYDSLRSRPRFAGDHLAIRGAAFELFAMVEGSEMLPEIVSTARAWAAAERGGVNESVLLLRHEVEGGASRWLADAQWELSVRLLELAESSGESLAVSQRLEAMEALTALFAQSPQWPDALRACQLAGALAERMPEWEADAAVLTLEAALRVFPEDADADGWRFALAQRTSDVGRRRELLASVSTTSNAYVPARVLLVDMQHAVLQESNEADRMEAARELVVLFDVAIGALEGVSGSEEFVVLRERMDAQAMEALLLLEREADAVALAREHAGSAHKEVWLGPMSSQVRRGMIRARRAMDEAETKRMALLLVEVCRLRESMVQVAARDRMRRLVLAEALLESDDARGAVALYTTLRDELGQRADLTAGQGEAQFRLGEVEEAFSLFRLSVEAMEEGGSLGEEFWHGWARMLQMLAMKNEDNSRSSSIRLELRRLERLDAGYGVPPWSEYLKEMAEDFAVVETVR